MFLDLPTPVLPNRSGVAMLTVAAFFVGAIGGALLATHDAGRESESVALAVALTRAPESGSLRAGHPADVLRVIDGDTFEARVNIWPGVDITTKVRLRNIDAPEMRPRCEDERVKAVTARDALARMLAEGDVGLWRIGQDRYGGRVDAHVSTRHTPDVAAALLKVGVVRSYDGGRRGSWCDDRR
jgi:endonuclease YncB( thermonuclease family)